MKQRLPLDGPADQPLDIVPRRCNTFHFISFHWVPVLQASSTSGSGSTRQTNSHQHQDSPISTGRIDYRQCCQHWGCPCSTSDGTDEDGLEGTNKAFQPQSLLQFVVVCLFCDSHHISVRLCCDEVPFSAMSDVVTSNRCCHTYII